MKKALLFLVAGLLCLEGCRAGQQSEIKGAQEFTAKQRSPSGLDFLVDIPSLKGVSLKMSEAEFLEIVQRQELKYKREVKNDSTTYYVEPEGKVIVISGFRQGHCTGIQRMRS